VAPQFSYMQRSDMVRKPCRNRDSIAPRRHCQVDGAGVFGCLMWVGHTGFVDAAPSSLYKGHRYSVEIISHCVWLYAQSDTGTTLGDGDAA
jgi:hypothetical protein